MKTKVMNELKELYQNCPDTMDLIKVIVASSLFGAFIVFAPSKIVLPVVLIAIVVLLVGLIVWSFKQERHMYDRDKPKMNY
jgi:cytochrome c-type biogenesis protein CcmH/NrfF